MIVAIFGLVIYLSAAMHKLSAGAATGFFMLYAALMGIFLGPVLLVYTHSSVTQAFVVTAGMFGGMSLYGTVTKRDLTGMGSFLIMGLWGIILACIVNIFLRNSALDFAISVIGVIVFAGLTAYDTQKLRAHGRKRPSGRQSGHPSGRHPGRVESVSRLRQHVPHAAASVRQPQLARA